MTLCCDPRYSSLTLKYLAVTVCRHKISRAIGGGPQNPKSDRIVRETFRNDLKNDRAALRMHEKLTDYISKASAAFKRGCSLPAPPSAMDFELERLGAR